jgi:hypothetical protein
MLYHVVPVPRRWMTHSARKVIQFGCLDTVGDDVYIYICVCECVSKFNGSRRYRVNLAGPAIQDGELATDYKIHGPAQTSFLTPGTGAYVYLCSRGLNRTQHVIINWSSLFFSKDYTSQNCLAIKIAKNEWTVVVTVILSLSDPLNISTFLEAGKYHTKWSGERGSGKCTRSAMTSNREQVEGLTVAAVLFYNSRHCTGPLAVWMIVTHGRITAQV